MYKYLYKTITYFTNILINCNECSPQLVTHPTTEPVAVHYGIDWIWPKEGIINFSAENHRTTGFVLRSTTGPTTSICRRPESPTHCCHLPSAVAALEI